MAMHANPGTATEVESAELRCCRVAEEEEEEAKTALTRAQVALEMAQSRRIQAYALLESATHSVAQAARNGFDTTEWLPDDILLYVFALSSVDMLWNFALVCKRWACLMRTSAMHRARGRLVFRAYNEFGINPLQVFSDSLGNSVDQLVWTALGIYSVRKECRLEFNGQFVDYIGVVKCMIVLEVRC
jgi:uncharacterized cysteine cluster protein YcgN (CxxCxxCC family)